MSWTLTFDNRLGAAFAGRRPEGGEPALLAIAAPSLGYEDSEYQSGGTVHLHQAPFVDQGAASTIVSGGFDDHRYEHCCWHSVRLGTALADLDDYTGDGEVDLVAFDHPDDADFPTHTFLLPGPLPGLDNPKIDEPPVVQIPVPEAVRGTTGGDLSGDGISDLCTNAGVVFGPLGPSSTAAVTWSAVPAADARVAAGDLDGDGAGEVLLWDPAAAAVRRLTDFAPRDLDPTTAAATWTAPGPGVATDPVLADLDGDGDLDFAIGWSDGADARVFVVTDTAGGALEASHAVLTGLVVTALAAADLDGDGADDLVVGGGNAVRVFRGPLPAGALGPEHAAVQWVGETDRDAFGDALLALDLDADGRAELLIGAPDYGLEIMPPFPEGKAYLVPGGAY